MSRSTLIISAFDVFMAFKNEKNYGQWRYNPNGVPWDRIKKMKNKNEKKSN